MTTQTASKTRLTLTERKLIEMLTENTGRAMCDSGDYYGRNWQRNQDRKFTDEPVATLQIEPENFHERRAGIEVTLNVFHWLNARLTYDPVMTARFQRFAKKPENEDSPYLPLMEDFARDVRNGAGLYGDGRPMTVNTYNGEDSLSQIIQYVFWTEGTRPDRRAYVLLQVHGGCDARGGYTAPKAFEVTGDDETCILDNSKATIFETLPDDLVNGRQGSLPGMDLTHVTMPYWYSDDGYHWYYEGTYGSGAGAQLETYEVSYDPADKGQGRIYIDPDGTAYGPIYGGKLEVSGE